MTLIDDLISIKADLHSIPVDLGLPQYRTIAVRKSQLNDGEITPIFKDFVLEPPVHIANVPTRYVGMELTRNTVVIAQDDFFVKNLPRLYAKEFLELDIEFYTIDPVIQSGAIVGGIKCQLLDVLDSKALSWQLVLRKMSDRELSPVVQAVTIKNSSEAIDVDAIDLSAGSYPLSDSTDLAYSYRGGVRLDGSWVVERTNKSTQAVTIAVYQNNPNYIFLLNAWSSRDDLEYS